MHGDQRQGRNVLNNCSEVAERLGTSHCLLSLSGTYVFSSSAILTCRGGSELDLGVPVAYGMWCLLCARRTSTYRIPAVGPSNMSHGGKFKDKRCLTEYICKKGELLLYVSRRAFCTWRTIQKAEPFQGWPVLAAWLGECSSEECSERETGGGKDCSGFQIDVTKKLPVSTRCGREEVTFRNTSSYDPHLLISEDWLRLF